MNIGTLFIISAPSGAGKTSLVNALLKTVDHISLSISYTTRPARPGEIDEVDYFFVDEDHFRQLVEKSAFLESAKVFDHYYGTLESQVESYLQNDQDVILEIDWQGAYQIKQRMPECVSIFIMPPSLDDLENRLRERKQDDETVIMRRMRDAKKEIEHYPEYDYLVINDIFDQALQNLAAIVMARRLRMPSQAIRQKGVLEKLLND